MNQHLIPQAPGPNLNDLATGTASPSAVANRPVIANEIPIFVRLLLLPIGAIPVTLIGAATFGIVSLKTLAITVLAPALCLLIVLVSTSEPTRRLAGTAVMTGVVATLLYDLFRWSFLLFGLMEQDPIPHIGTSLDLHPGWAFGYLWRYVGNGGGLAVVFFAAGARGPVPGAIYGLLVCSGLVGVLLIAPYGQETLFPLNPATYVVAIVGHIIYGASLGYLARRVTSSIAVPPDA